MERGRWDRDISYRPLAGAKILSVPSGTVNPAQNYSSLMPDLYHRPMWIDGPRLLFPCRAIQRAASLDKRVTSVAVRGIIASKNKESTGTRGLRCWTKESSLCSRSTKVKNEECPSGERREIDLRTRMHTYLTVSHLLFTKVVSSKIHRLPKDDKDVPIEVCGTT